VQASVFFELGALVVSVSYLLLASKLPFGKVTHPGAGFLPVVIGSLGVIIAAWLLCQSCLAWMKRKKTAGSSPQREPYNWPNLMKIGLYVVTVAVIIALFETLGSVICIFLFTLLLTKMYGMPGWLKPILLSFITSGVIYLVFEVWFKIPLPGLSL